MSNILLALLFALLCFTQWQLSRQGTSLLCYLPIGLYLLIVGAFVLVQGFYPSRRIESTI